MDEKELGAAIIWTLLMILLGILIHSLIASVYFYEQSYDQGAIAHYKEQVVVTKLPDDSFVVTKPKVKP